MQPEMYKKLDEVANRFIRDLGSESYEDTIMEAKRVASAVVDGSKMPPAKTPLQIIINSCAHAMLNAVNFQKPVAHQSHPATPKMTDNSNTRT